MVNQRTYKMVAAALFAVVLASCAPDAATRPEPAQANAALVGGTIGTVTGVVTGTVDYVAPQLLACKVTKSYTASRVIGPSGGTIAVGPHTFIVPPGALGSNVTITASAPAGSQVIVNFQPEGLRFAAPAALTLSYRDCSLTQQLLLKVGYVSDQLKILSLVNSANNVFTRTVTGKIDHFSGYAIVF
jgi:hypothetical protein